MKIKIKHYCLNDRFAYCSDAPRANMREETFRVAPSGGCGEDCILRKEIPCCDLDIKTCGNFVKASDLKQK